MKSIFYIPFLLFQVLSFGQEVIVSGKVVEKKTGEPLPSANIIIDKTTKGIQTDFDGNYSIKVNLNDTLVFSFVGMKSQKVKADTAQINVELEEGVILKEYAGPAYHPVVKKLQASQAVTKVDIEKGNDPKYNFKKNAKNNLFIIFVSKLTDYNFSKEDLEFQQKYNVKYSLIGCYGIEYLEKHNKLTFKHLKRKYKKTWLAEIRKDAVGLQD